MQRVKPFVAMILSLGLLCALWSCRTPAGRTAGEVVDDSVITTKVKTKLLNDPIVQAFAIDVDTFEGQVTLTGAVDSSQAKKRAREIAKSVDGVKKVNNLLKIRQR